MKDPLTPSLSPGERGNGEGYGEDHGKDSNCWDRDDKTGEKERGRDLLGHGL
jgi:hypothetical protein